MLIKAISDNCGNFLSKPIVKKTQVGHVVASLFPQFKVQGRYFSSSAINNQLLEFPGKARIALDLKDHFSNPNDQKIIENVSELFANRILDMDDDELCEMREWVGNVMLMHKFPTSEYAPIYQQKMTEALIKSAAVWKG